MQVSTHYINLNNSFLTINSVTCKLSSNCAFTPLSGGLQFKSRHHSSALQFLSGIVMIHVWYRQTPKKMIDVSPVWPAWVCKTSQTQDSFTNDDFQQLVFLIPIFWRLSLRLFLSNFWTTIAIHWPGC